MRELFRTLPLICLVLLVPIVPFLVFGWHAEELLRGYSESEPSLLNTSVLVIALLASDIFLPIPSSMVSTLSGWQLGWWRGALAAWLGMNLGATFGFAVARRWGMGVALWFSKEEILERMQSLTGKFGAYLIVLTRAVPVFAEACILIVGIHRLSWRKFLPPVILSNLGVAIAYGAFGDLAERHKWLPLALAVSVALPILLTAAARGIMGTGGGAPSTHVDLGEEQHDPEEACEGPEIREEIVSIPEDPDDAHGKRDEGKDHHA